MSEREGRRRGEGTRLFTISSINKLCGFAYNKGVEEVVVTDGSARSSFITYLYNAVLSEIVCAGGGGELVFGEERTAFRMRLTEGREDVVKERLAEILGIGYKYAYLKEKLHACLPKRERKLLIAALIAADYEGDKAYIRSKIGDLGEFAIDGFYTFRLGSLREKWTRIIDYIPEGFSSQDLKKFCEFLVGESKNKIYLKGRAVFGENFAPLRRSRLTGEEDVETEIMLSDAGFVYCLGEVEEGTHDFLQKYYAERAIFS